jgi:lipopolysaccharide/colanic/teichoic acid biosynthesis glycosyltransferase
MPQYERLKRLLDLCLCVLLSAPVIAMSTSVALLIVIFERQSPLFWQKRAGLNGLPFRFPKFRTMIVGAEDMLPEIRHLNGHTDSITFKMEDDMRVTPLGRHLRRWSLDELPQFWSVLMGDMSLVGPRPALMDEVAKYSDLERKRLEVQPGLTCLWQVSGRSELPFCKQLELDLEYIRTRSLSLDIQIILKTVPAVLSTRGAY